MLAFLTPLYSLAGKWNNLWKSLRILMSSSKWYCLKTGSQNYNGQQSSPLPINLILIIISMHWNNAPQLSSPSNCCLSLFTHFENHHCDSAYGTKEWRTALKYILLLCSVHWVSKQLLILTASHGKAQVHVHNIRPEQKIQSAQLQK